ASASSTGGGSAVRFFEPVFFALCGMTASYAKIAAVAQERKTLDANAYALMLLLTALWGFQQVTIKWISAEVSFVMQAAVRSIMASALLFVWARRRCAVRRRIRVHLRRPGVYQRLAHVGVHLSHAGAHRAR